MEVFCEDRLVEVHDVFAATWRRARRASSCEILWNYREPSAER
jgi:hypothetical protein